MMFSRRDACHRHLKKRFTEAPVLLMPDKAKAFTVESDASKFATGAVLRQADINGDMHPCGYLSQSLDAAQRNYEIYDRELLGIVRALEEWRHYLEGNPYPVRVLSDHKNLEYFRTAQKLNCHSRLDCATRQTGSKLTDGYQRRRRRSNKQ